MKKFIAHIEKFSLVLNKKRPITYPGHSVVLYTFTGQDPLFPLVGEIVSELKPGIQTTTPSKWTIDGHYRIGKSEDDVSVFDLPLEEWLEEEFPVEAHWEPYRIEAVF